MKHGPSFLLVLLSMFLISLHQQLELLETEVCVNLNLSISSFLRFQFKGGLNSVPSLSNNIHVGYRDQRNLFYKRSIELKSLVDFVKTI